MLEDNKKISGTDVEILFPEIHLISDNVLKEQCKHAFVTAFELGGWTKKNVNLCPVSITKVGNIELNSQIDHVRVVTDIAVSMYDKLEEKYKKDTKIRDYVIAGALLHDLGKMTEFSLKNGKPQYADNANLIRHPLGGSIIASKVGIRDEVIHIIATHSFEGDNSYESLESSIVKMADNIAFKYITFFNEEYKK